MPSIYAAAETAYAIVQTGERRFYGDILLTKGVVAPEKTGMTGCSPHGSLGAGSASPKADTAASRRAVPASRAPSSHASLCSLWRVTLILLSKTSLCDYSVMLHRKPPSGDSVRSICGMFFPLGAHA